ncbi:GGDEF domain-containing protein [Alteromonas sp. CYL-A6]|uniref:GGDEF domain-containing protein n=1 Tax=Alteromonas nitratireducens TaxID=3390813 RepID=UPI0034AEE63C
MIIAEESELPWRLVGLVKSLVRPFGLSAILFGIFSLLGYWGSMEVLYRPIENGSATHPLTALIVTLLGFSYYINSDHFAKEWVVIGLSLSALAISIFRLIDIANGTELADIFTPFMRFVESEQAQGMDNRMGANTAIMLAGVSTASLAKSFQRPILSQLLASISFSIPLISMLGYAYSIGNFYGHMSLITANAGIALSVAALFSTASEGPLKAVLSPYIGGKIARFQVIAGYLVPIMMGYLLVRTIVTAQGSLFGLFVIGICWFILIMVGASAIIIEIVDSERRDKERKLRLAATTDELTGLPNRKMFFDASQHEFARINRLHTEAWVLMIDIDNFKNINDTQGHAIGDMVLRAVGKTLTSSLREVDLVGRIGGEEFAIMLPDTTKEGAKRVAENIRTKTEKIQVKGRTDMSGPVTVSIGVALAKPESNVKTTLAQADMALYNAKHGGKNQVHFLD